MVARERAFCWVGLDIFVASPGLTLAELDFVDRPVTKFHGPYSSMDRTAPTVHLRCSSVALFGCRSSNPLRIALVLVSDRMTMRMMDRERQTNVENCNRLANLTIVCNLCFDCTECRNFVPYLRTLMLAHSCHS